MKITIGRKSFVKFGLLSILVLSVALAGYFFVLHVPIVSAPVAPGVVGGRSVTINITTSDANQTDEFFTCNNTVWIRANVSCSGGSVCNDTLNVTANFTDIGAGWRRGVNISGLDGGDTRLFEFNASVLCDSITITRFQMANVTVNASISTEGPGTIANIGWTTPLLVNMSTIPGCPPAGENIQLPPRVPLANDTMVNVIGECWTNCTADDHAQYYNSTHYVLCGPTFGPDSLNFTQTAYNGNFSAVPLVMDIPGVVKINFTTPVNMSDQQKSSAIMQFAMKNMMAAGRVGINETEWDGTGGKPDMTGVSATITIYNLTGRLGLPSTSRPSIGYRSGYGSGAFGVCPASVCSAFIWDGQNLTFNITGFSEYSIERGISVLLNGTDRMFNPPQNISYSNVRNINFSFTPKWNATTTVKNATLFGNFTGPHTNFTANAWNTTPLVNNTLNYINFTVNATELTYIWNVVVYDALTGSDTNEANHTVIYDATTPVFNTTTPTNNSYISGNTSQLFQVYVYDRYLNTSNVSLHWQLSSDGSPANWTNGTKISCYAQTSPLFICNTTINDLYYTYGNGAIFSFYFRGTDNATNYGNNGSATVPLTTTIDRNAPTNTTSAVVNVTSNTRYDASRAYSFQMSWTDSPAGVSTVIFEHNFSTGDLANTTADSCGGSTYCANFTGSQFINASTFVYRWYANDSVQPTTSANWARTDQFIYMIAQADNPVTLYLNDTANSNVLDLRYPNTVNATAVATAGEPSLWRNVSGAWTDVSTTENRTNMVLSVGAHAYTVNTSGNANYSENISAPSYYIVISKGIVALGLSLNTTTEANYSIVYPAAVNASGNKSATVGSEYNMSLYRDGVIVNTTLTLSQIRENIQLANGTYNYSLVFNGSANYTDTSVTADRFVLVSKGPTTLNLLLNGTSFNITVAKDAYVNATVTVDHTLEGNTTHNITLYVDNALYNSSDTLTMIENLTSYSAVAGYAFNITGSYPEAQNYSVGNQTFYVNIESTAPTYRDNNTNVTASVWGKYQGVIGVNAAWNDNFNISRVWMFNNTTGSWGTTYGSFGANNVSNFTINPDVVDVSGGNAVIQAILYANDTSNNTNNTNTFSWTIDGTTPVLSNPSPANQSYATRNDSYPFRVTVTDYTLNVSNATVRWKRSSAGAYSSGSMTCTGNAPTFTCLKSDVDLSIYLDGDQIYYYFEASDNSSLLGTLGNSSNPYVVTLDISAPRYSNNGTNVTVVSRYGAVLIYANWTDADNLEYAVLETNESGVARNYTDGTHGSPVDINNTAGQTWSNFTWTNNTLTAGTVILWRIFANDSVGNINVTTNVTFMIDNTAPQINYNETNVTNNTQIARGTVIAINVQWTDNVALHVWELFANSSSISGSLMGSLDGTSSWGNATIITSSLTPGTVLRANVSANDTTNNRNWTNTFQWTIDNERPAPIAFSTNTSNTSTLARGSSVSVSANWTDNIGLSHYWVWFNETDTTGYNDTAHTFAATNYSNSTAIVNTSNIVPGTLFQIKFYANDTSRNENVSEVWQYTIDNTPPIYTDNGTNVTSGSIIVKGTAIYVYANWTDNVNLSQGFVEQNFTTGNTLANISTSFAPANWTNYTLTTSSLTAGSTYVARLFANDTSGNGNFTSPTWSWTIDGTAPTYANISRNGTAGNGTVEYAPGATYIFNVSWTDNLGDGNVSKALLNLSFASTNYTADVLGNSNYSVTATDLPVGDYWYKWYANDTSDNWNETEAYSFNVTINTSTSSYMNLTINSTANVQTEANRTTVYPEAVNVTGNVSEVNAFSGQDITFTLYRNDGTTETQIGTGSVKNEVVLGNGTYNYTYITAGNANYSAANKSYYVFVNKGATTCGINPAVSQTITYETSIDPYCYSNATEVQCTLWRDNSNVTLTENSTGAIVYGVDNSPYVFRSNNTETGNYTACAAATFTLTVNKKAFTFGLSPAASPVTYGALVTQYATSNDTAANSKLTLWRSNVNITDRNNTAETLDWGYWQFVANSTHPAANYSWTEQSLLLLVNKADPANNMTLTLDGSASSTQTREYSNQTTILATKNATGDGNCVWYLIRNGTNVLASENNTQIQLNASGWNYTYYVTDCTNYTNGQVEIFVNMQKRPTNMSLWIANTSYPENVQGDREIELGVDVNFTAVITNATYPLWLNITTNISAAQGWVNQTRLSVNSNISNITETAGFSVAKYNITAHFDGDENHTADSVTYYLNITDDVTAPSVKLFNDVTNDYAFNNSSSKKQNAQFALNVSVSDTGVGTVGKTCYVTIGGSSAGSVVYSNGWCNVTATVPAGLDDGPRVLNVSINDTNTNTGFNDTYYITVDNTAPVLTITFPAANGTYNKSDSSGYIWINGTVSDNLQMGMANVSINGTYFNDSATTARPFNFTGGNDTAFAYRNTSAIPDGYYVFVMNYTDNATNIGNVSVTFTVDNTPPSAVYGLTNSSSQNYAATTSQNIQVLVQDARQTNETITLHYYINGTWFTTTLTGTPSTSTTYSGSISTVGDDYKVDSSGRAYIPYYVTGIDNATNPMSSNNGSAASPLANLTLGTTGAIDGYIIQNGSSTTYISGATVSVNKTGVVATTSGSDGYYYISGLTAEAYIVKVNATNYVSNQSDATTVTAGSTTRVNVTIANNATGVIQGYVRLTNTTIAPNSTSVIAVSDGTRTVGVNTAGFYQITGVPAGTYTVTVSGTGYWTNTTSATVTAGATTTANISVTGAENFNVTIPGSSTASATVGTNGFLDSGWHAFRFSTSILSGGTTNYTVERLFTSAGVAGNYNYSSIWRYNSTAGSWVSFVPSQASTLVNVTSSDEQYYVHANATDRVEIEPRYT